MRFYLGICGCACKRARAHKRTEEQVQFSRFVSRVGRPNLMLWTSLWALDIFHLNRARFWYLLRTKTALFCLRNCERQKREFFIQRFFRGRKAPKGVDFSPSELRQFLVGWVRDQKFSLKHSLTHSSTIRYIKTPQIYCIYENKNSKHLTGLRLSHLAHRLHPGPLVPNLKFSFNKLYAKHHKFSI